MRRFWSVILAIVLLGFSLGCSSSSFSQVEANSGETVQPIQEENPEAVQSVEAEDSPPAELVEDLKSVVSARTGVPSYEVMFVSAEAVEWPDACLGAPNPDELCAQVITPGYRIVLSTLTEEYTFHTDRTGEQVQFIAPEE